MDLVSLSPDGSFAMVQTVDHSDVHDVATGSKDEVGPMRGGWGWGSDSQDVVGVEGSSLATCSTSSGQCHVATVPDLGKDPFVRYAGFAFESWSENLTVRSRHRLTKPPTRVIWSG
jgi:hypothetical protein